MIENVEYIGSFMNTSWSTRSMKKKINIQILNLENEFSGRLSATL